MGEIYRIFSDKSPLSYIGQTRRNSFKRVCEHIEEAKRYTNTKLNKFLRLNADSIKFEVLKICNNDELDFWERHYIKEYDSFNNGLNSNTGGSGNKDIDYSRNNLKINDIINDYENGKSITYITSKHGVSESYLYFILKLNLDIHRDKSEKTPGTNSKKPIIMYNTKFIAQMKFESIMDAGKWLGESDYRNLYRRLNAACVKGNIYKGFRWQYLNDLIYNNIEFNTKFDKEAYIKTGICYKNNIGLMESKNETVDRARGIYNICPKCGGYKSIKAECCINCYNETKNSFANRQVPNELTLSYPLSKDEMSRLYPKYTISSIAKACNVSYSTIDRLAKNMGLNNKAQ